MKEWLISGMLIGTINIPINYLRHHLFIFSSSDYYFLNAVVKSGVVTCIFIFVYDYNCIIYNYAIIAGALRAIQKYLYINTRDVSCIDIQYIERIITMLGDSVIWDTWNAMCFGGGTIIANAVLLFDNIKIGDWFYNEHTCVLPLSESLLGGDSFRNNDRNLQYVGSILLGSAEHITLKTILYYNTDTCITCMASIVFFYTMGDTLVFTTIKIIMDGPFILDNYDPVENIRNIILILVFIVFFERLYDCGLIFILSYKPNIGYALIVLDSYKLVEECVTWYKHEMSDILHECTIVGVCLYIYGALFFYPTFIFID